MDAQADLDRTLDHMVRRAESTIAHRFADARSHASVGLMPLAHFRLGNLLDALATDDGRGLIGDAAERGYRDAFRLVPHDPNVHADHWRYPTAAGVKAVRAGTAAARKEAATLIDRARQYLPLIDGDRDAIDAWHDEHRARLVRWAKTAISDHQTLLFHRTRHLRVKKELRGDRG